MSEVERIMDQVHRGFAGHAWHGPSVMATLKGVTVKQAAARPVRGAHTIHEIVPHIGVWKRVVAGRLTGKPWRPSKEENFPTFRKPTAATWKAALAQLKKDHKALMRALAKLSDKDLRTPLRPGRKETIYFLLHGIVQHDIYHAGQIAVLKKGR